jgi:hypothetical protein
MSLFRKIQSFKAPKTEDSAYDQALAIYETIGVDPSTFATAIRHFMRNVTDLISACHRSTDHVSAWISEGPPDLHVEMHEIVHDLDSFDQFTSTLLASRIDPNFIAPLREYELSVAHLRKKKKDRTQARKEYDKMREYLRLLESDKKTKKDKMEQARVKHDEVKRRYEQANSDFIQSVHALAEERRTTLAKPFHDLSAIVAQYIRAVTARSAAAIGPAVREANRAVGQSDKKRKTIIQRSAPDLGLSVRPRAGSITEIAPVEFAVRSDGFINPMYAGMPAEEIDDGWMGMCNPVGRAEGWAGMIGEQAEA